MGHPVKGDRRERHSRTLEGGHDSASSLSLPEFGAKEADDVDSSPGAVFRAVFR
jgi:hypothetical protein